MSRMAREADESVDLSDVPQAVLLAWGVLPATTKGPKPRWTLDQLLATAVRLGDEGGVEAITMSGLAKALGSGTMSLYRYVESREDLVILAADHALGPGAARGDGTPQDQLRAWVRDLRSAYERHRWLTAIPVGTEPLLPSYLRRLDTGLACLEPLGITGTRAITVLTMLWTYTRGDVEQAAHLAELSSDRPAAEVNKLVAARISALGGGEAARVLAALEDDPGVSDEEEFDAAIDLIINGLRG